MDTSITHGRKLFPHPVSMDICRACAKLCRDRIEWKVKMEYSRQLFNAEYYGKEFSVEVLDIRAERRESRDLMRDLEDIRSGIRVVHASDMEKLHGGCRGADGDGYLPGCMRQTLVVYFSARKWDGPMSLHEMFGEQDARVLALVPDYKINLVAPASIKDSDFDKFQTSLKEVLSFIKYSQDADRLSKAVEADEGFRHLGWAEADVLNACAGANLEMEKDSFCLISD